MQIGAGILTTRRARGPRSCALQHTRKRHGQTRRTERSMGTNGDWGACCAIALKSLQVVDEWPLNTPGTGERPLCATTTSLGRCKLRNPRHHPRVRRRPHVIASRIGQGPRHRPLLGPGPGGTPGRGAHRRGGGGGVAASKVRRGRRGPSRPAPRVAVRCVWWLSHGPHAHVHRCARAAGMRRRSCSAGFQRRRHRVCRSQAIASAFTAGRFSRDATRRGPAMGSR